MEKEMNRLTGGLWLLFAAFIAIALLVNAIHAIFGQADFAWWHLFTLMLSWWLARAFSEGQSDVLLRAAKVKFRNLQKHVGL